MSPRWGSIRFVWHVEATKMPPRWRSTPRMFPFYQNVAPLGLGVSFAAVLPTCRPAGAGRIGCFGSTKMSPRWGSAFRSAAVLPKCRPAGAGVSFAGVLPKYRPAGAGVSFATVLPTCRPSGAGRFFCCGATHMSPRWGSTHRMLTFYQNAAPMGLGACNTRLPCALRPAPELQVYNTVWLY